MTIKTNPDIDCKHCDRHLIVWDALDFASWILKQPKPEFKGMGAGIYAMQYQKIVSKARWLRRRFKCEE